MDSKFYIEWHGSLGKWVVKYADHIQAQFNNQEEALHWGQRNYRNHGREIERVQVRSNSPRGAKVGEWR